jgi:hypothetical protein
MGAFEQRECISLLSVQQRSDGTSRSVHFGLVVEGRHVQSAKTAATVKDTGIGNTIDPSSVRLELNQKFDLLPIFKRDRSTALYHLCAALEMSTNPYTVDPDVAMALGRRVLEASMRAISGTYRKCPGVAAPLGAQFNSAAFAEAMELVEFAFRYEQIMYCFQLADREQFQVRYDPLEQRTVLPTPRVMRALRIRITSPALLLSTVSSKSFFTA